MADGILITGGAGFIGANLAGHYLTQGRRVVVYDNFSRPGALVNRRWLEQRWGDRVEIIAGDVCEPDPRFAKAVEASAVVYHLAAQVAVTTSVQDPRHDFRTNALGTFNVLEAVRTSRSRPAVIYASTNKVYGKMEQVDVVDEGNRYRYANAPHGIDEHFPLDFYSPYGCSKGTGDQYALDYARIYGLRTVVFRQSCIYGPHQFGMEDQGWVAWFTIRAMQQRGVTVYGDGKQVRDVLWIGDLVAAYDAAFERIDAISGRAYNIGGGSDYTLSLLELIAILDRRFGRPLKHAFDQWRPGDQKVFVSDVRAAERDFGWRPDISPEAGVEQLAAWLCENKVVVDEVAR
ncbi:MAG: NAD-dependent epimerase/dehydratase family protein [Gemmatimonadales bacterium]